MPVIKKRRCAFCGDFGVVRNGDFMCDCFYNGDKLTVSVPIIIADDKNLPLFNTMIVHRLRETRREIQKLRMDNRELLERNQLLYKLWREKMVHQLADIPTHWEQVDLFDTIPEEDDS